MQFKLWWGPPCLPNFAYPTPSAAELACRAAVDVALIDARMAEVDDAASCPRCSFGGYCRGFACFRCGYDANRAHHRAQPYPDERPPGPIEYLAHPGARVLAIR